MNLLWREAAVGILGQIIPRKRVSLKLRDRHFCQAKRAGIKVIGQVKGALRHSEVDMGDLHDPRRGHVGLKVVRLAMTDSAEEGQCLVMKAMVA